MSFNDYCIDFDNGIVSMGKDFIDNKSILAINKLMSHKQRDSAFDWWGSVSEADICRVAMRL